MANGPETRGEDWKNESKSAKERVEAWLTQAGTTLEFEASSIFQRGGYERFHGFHLEQVSGLPLEVDVLAFRNVGTGPRPIAFEFIVECKHAPTPWVVFTQPHSPQPFDCVATELAKAALFVMRKRKISRIDPRIECAMFGFSATSLRDHKGSGNQRDLAYDALHGAVARSYLRRKLLDSHGPIVCSITRPLVVVRGGLCSAAWNETTKRIDVLEVPWISVHWRGSPDGFANADIVRIDSLEEYLATLQPQISALLDQLKSFSAEVRGAVEESSLLPLVLGDLDEDELPEMLRPLARSDSNTELIRAQLSSSRRKRDMDDM